MALRDIFPGVVAQEALVDKELEYVFYGKLTQPAELDQALFSVDQEQWQIRVDKETKLPFFGSVRVRRSDSKKDGTKYELCMKSLHAGSEDKDETEVELPEGQGEAFFEQAKKLATSGMKKRRYYFPVQGKDLTWEVDVYYDTQGNQVPWCKIDLEVTDWLDGVTKDSFPLPFPVSLAETIYAQPSERDAKTRAKVKQLMDEVFLLPNPYLRSADVGGDRDG